MFFSSFICVCVGVEWCVELPCTTGAAVQVDESALKKAHDWPGNQFCEDSLNTLMDFHQRYSTQMASEVTLGH